MNFSAENMGRHLFKMSDHAVRSDGVDADTKRFHEGCMEFHYVEAQAEAEKADDVAMMLSIVTCTYHECQKRLERLRILEAREKAGGL